MFDFYSFGKCHLITLRFDISSKNRFGASTNTRNTCQANSLLHLIKPNYFNSVIKPNMAIIGISRNKWYGTDARYTLSMDISDIV